MKNWPQIYKRTSTGSIQVWWVEQDENRYRNHSGKLNGAIVTSGWQVAQAKNVGRSNATTPEEQAHAEISSMYEKRMKHGYHSSVEAVDERVSYFEPMLAKGFEETKKWDVTKGVFSEPKLDGIRCIATIDGLFTRSGEEILSCPHVHAALSKFFDEYPQAVVDGELYNHKLKDDFNEIVSLVKSQTDLTEEDYQKTASVIEYHVYEIIVDGKPVFRTSFPWYDLVNKDVIKKIDTRLLTSWECINHLYKEYIEAGYEGQMLRPHGYLYENKRSKYLVKRKEFMTDEFEIVRIEAGKGKRSDKAGRIICLTKKKVEFSASITGSFEYCVKLLEEADKYVGGQATIKFQNYTPAGKPRFTTCLAVYEGKRTM